MTAQPIEFIDESLDFDFDPPCEHSQHDVSPWHSGPAWALIQDLPCPSCGTSQGDFYLCHAAWEASGNAVLRCDVCNHHVPRSQAWRFIALVRP